MTLRFFFDFCKTTALRHHEERSDVVICISRQERASFLYLAAKPSIQNKLAILSAAVGEGCLIQQYAGMRI